jgi:hypothetical protein
MKHFLSAGVFFLFSICGYCQTITWSPIMSPKNTDGYITLMAEGSPGVSGYYLSEGGYKSDEYISLIGTDLTVQNSSTIERDKADEKDNERYRTIYLNNKAYMFFIDKHEKGPVFTISAEIKNLDGTVVKNKEAVGKSDIRGVKVFSDKASTARTLMEIKAGYDGKTILLASINETVNKEYSMLNVTEFDENLKQLSSNNYKVPFQYYHMYSGRYQMEDKWDPDIKDIKKDANGFVYLFIKSGPDADDHNPLSLYQFKPSDPTYSKSYKNEWAKGWAPVQTKLFQDQMGRVYLVNLGYEYEKKKDMNEKGFVNSGFIGCFAKDGQLKEILAQRLSTDMLSKIGGKENIGAINSLQIKNIFSTTDGGFYIIWQEEMAEWNMGPQYYNEGPIAKNLLIQYYGNDNKLAWEKVVYKNQENLKNATRTTPDAYMGIRTFLANDVLYIFYPDDPSNANKGIDDKNVNKFSVVSSFGQNDRTGFMLTTFTKSGNYTKKYFDWAADKKGYGLVLPSIKYVGNNEFIGMVRALHQRMSRVTEGDYSVFKLKL